MAFYAYVGENIVYLGFGIIHGFRYPLGGSRNLFLQIRVDYYNYIMLTL